MGALAGQIFRSWSDQGSAPSTCRQTRPHLETRLLFGVHEARLARDPIDGHPQEPSFASRLAIVSLPLACRGPSLKVSPQSRGLRENVRRETMNSLFRGDRPCPFGPVKDSTVFYPIDWRTIA